MEDIIRELSEDTGKNYSGPDVLAAIQNRRQNSLQTARQERLHRARGVELTGAQYFPFEDSSVATKAADEDEDVELRSIEDSAGESAGDDWRIKGGTKPRARVKSSQEGSKAKAKKKKKKSQLG